MTGLIDDYVDNIDDKTFALCMLQKRKQSKRESSQLQGLQC